MIEQVFYKFDSLVIFTHSTNIAELTVIFIFVLLIHKQIIYMYMVI